LTLAYAHDSAGYRAMLVMNETELNDEVALRMMHKRRAKSSVIPQVAREASAQWLKAHRAKEAANKDTPTPPKARSQTKSR
jgi:hypothetical protein